MKKIVIACGLFVLGAFGIGCGGPDCGSYVDSAEAKGTECEIELTGVPAEPTGDACTQAVADLYSCYAGCVDGLSCDALKGMDNENLTAYTDCVAKCAADAQ